MKGRDPKRPEDQVAVAFGKVDQDLPRLETIREDRDILGMAPFNPAPVFQVHVERDERLGIPQLEDAGDLHRINLSAHRLSAPPRDFSRSAGHAISVRKRAEGTHPALRIVTSRYAA
jgi:hypothetical protein